MQLVKGIMIFSPLILFTVDTTDKAAKVGSRQCITVDLFIIIFEEWRPNRVIMANQFFNSKKNGERS